MSTSPSFFARVRRWVLRLTILIAGPIVIAIAGLSLYMSSGRYVKTENAYVKAELIVISAQVSGQVTEVSVSDNVIVEAGDVLFRIDPRRFEVAIQRLKAELGAARARVNALKARHRTKLAELEAAERDAEFLTEEYERSDRLRSKGNISESKLLAARRLAVQAETKINVVREEIAEVLTALAGDPDLPVEAHSGVLKAQAELAQAQLDLQLATVRAPSAAIAANVRLQAGEYVEDGDAVLSLVSARGFWIEANLKETDLTHLKVGQSAELSVDAYPDVKWSAEVASLAPATGAEYALLPPQNASGNWVKVVQRIPVRLRIIPQDDAPDLRAGMSVAVAIDTGFERPLPEFVSKARAWIRPDAQ